VVVVGVTLTSLSTVIVLLRYVDQRSYAIGILTDLGDQILLSLVSNGRYRSH
jgi:hypothetical protein